MDSLEYNGYLEKFWEQKKLEEYQHHRSLVRPKTTKVEVGLYCALLFVLLLAVLLLIVYFNCSLLLKLLIAVVCIIIVLETYGRFLAIKMVECYQHYAPEEKRRSCKCIPSCSEYAILCFKKYEFLYALLKIRKRLFVTCKGFDYLVDNP